MKILDKSYLEKFEEYDENYGVYLVEDESVGLKGYIAIHRLNNGFPSLGATRLWRYATDEEALRDALRLSKLMSYKSALAGMPFGGAKAALVLPKDGIKDRNKFFTTYAKQVNELNGKFVTGTDVGVSNDDLDILRKASQFIIGMGVNSGYYTAIGVKYCIESVLSSIFGTSEVKERSFAIQGIGKTGSELLRLLIKSNVKNIIISDIDDVKIKKILAEFPFLKVVGAEEIHKQEVDIFSPSALSGVLNEKSVSELKCRAVVGSANNQLASPEIAEKLNQLGILYVPDYLANSGGIVSVVDQYINENPNEERILNDLKKIPKSLDLILKKSKSSGSTLEKEALIIANAFLNRNVEYEKVTSK
ncbi:MAG: Glu/Leu/Phe/Val dehydrogenase dimerization domain-containing protein [Patescibacteria group bacterium]|jgi:leucine dehydrogenase